MSAAGSRCRGLIRGADQLDSLLLENEGKPAREQISSVGRFEVRPDTVH